jgi:hypothetical protein
MKMVKSLLLGTAAGIVALSGAQAADLPVKAKPVQYVKICSLYGAGFYYIPGTDMCLKIGGWVRQQVGYGVNGSLTNGANYANQNTRGTQNFAMRSRGYITADARNQTEYGTVRSYIAVGLSSAAAASGTVASGDAPTGGNGFSANRAFIQFAGFTFGLTQSFYDLYSGPATSFFGGLVNPSSDTGDAGKAVTAYTAQLGNGLSATIGIEAQRNAGVIGVPGTSAATTGALAGAATPVSLPGSSLRAEQFPDVVANLRIDQAWGSAQIMGALHDASGTYYGATTSTGQPGDKLGYALGAGIKLRAPMIGAGDYFQSQVNYTVGAYGYTNAAGITLASKYNGGVGGSYGFGIASDGVYGAAGSSVELTTTWNVNAAYEHYWNKSWQTSVYGGYAKTTYSATANANLCANVDTAIIGAAAATLANGCNNNWGLWNIGSRTQWNIDSQTAMGVDIVYSRLQTATSGVAAVMPAAGTQPSGARSLSDQGSWMGQFRIHRNFYP